ncbi:MAG: beta-lactamase family protein [Marinospirillum sp.]|uniref:serine hydrolase domain-containing protein n=1 Tax=Marinospirillum sp. TaxID=2183934 RepID=UPI001A0BF0AA|nr:serine hydrolase domain-containing protein [Marinospirillum sp.]MBE0506915.1 beta-lactamase family protein [Marinospirillum sp.]
MNTDAAVSLMQGFLARSPRSAVEVQVMIKDQHWLWRYGEAEQVESPVFEIGSVGKTLTTTLLALLVQRGQVSLADPVERFYPDLPWASQVTLQQLASHTSGLPANPFSRWQMMLRGCQLAEAFEADDLMAFLHQLPSRLKPGGTAHYSNVGMALLGRILGDVWGGSYADAVQQLILQPLGMQDTHLEPSHYSPARLMQGHNSAGRPVPPFAWKGMEAAGVWRSTGDDMMRFLRAQMGFCGDPWDVLAGLTTQPQAKMNRDTQVGLGWMLSSIKSQGLVAWHNGGTFGQHCTVAWSPGISAAVVVLTDRMPPWWHHLMPSRQLESIPERLITALNQ